MGILRSKKISVISSWILVILWMLIIFTMSSQVREKSNNLSQGIVNSSVKNVEKLLPDVEFNVRRLNYIARKNAHFFSYLLLGILLIKSLNSSEMNMKSIIIIAITISVIYAISDEMHQYFVAGRSAQIKDVVIDSAGATVGVSIYVSYIKLKAKTI